MTTVETVRQNINELTAAFWTDQHVYDAVNEAQMEMWTRARWAITTATYTCTASQEYMTVPTAIMVPNRIVYGKQEWYPTSIVDLENYSRKWRTAGVGQPKWFVVWDAFKILMWPAPDSAYELKIVGLGWPTEIDAVTTDVEGDGAYRDAVANRACAVLLEMTRPDLADMYNKLADDAIVEFRQKLRNRGVRRIHRIRPGTVFTGAQSGVISIGKR